MSFFQKASVKPKPIPPQEENMEEVFSKGSATKERIDPRMVILEGSKLVKLVKDNPDIIPGKTDTGIAHFNNWIPVNYNPVTGEIIN